MSSPLIPRLVVMTDNHWSLHRDLDYSNLIAWRDNQQRVFARIQYIDGSYWIHWLNFASFCITPGSDSVLVWAYPEVNKDIINEIYFKGVLPYIVQLYGHEVLHASAVITEYGVVGFCGVSGSGKSTLAYGLYKHGYLLWTDDCLVFDIDGDEVNSYKIPSDVRLLPDSYELLVTENFDRLPSTLITQETDWGIQDRSPEKLVMLTILERSPIEEQRTFTQFTQLSGAIAYPRILTHAYALEVQEKSSKHRMLESYLNLITKIPIFELRYSTDLATFPEFIFQIQEKIKQVLR